jgi:hypothetical protein
MSLARASASVGGRMGVFRFLNTTRREALLATTLSSLTGAAISILVEAHSKPLIVASGIFTAVSLFLLRVRFRLLYGAIEIIFGLYVLWNVSDKGRGGFSSGFSAGFDTFQISVVLIQTFGAVYVLIRGLDNLLQGLPAENRAKFETRIREWHV